MQVINRLNASKYRSLVVDPALKFFEDALYLRSPPVRVVNLDRPCEKGLNRSSQLAKEGPSFYALGCEEVTRCGPVAIPSVHLNSCRLFSDVYNHTEPGSFVNTGSFLLYLAAKRTKRCTSANILGYSSHCQREMNTDRGIYKWSERVIRTKVRDWPSALGTFRRKVHIVVTPTVLRFAREYFSCPHLEGVELENQGGIGVSLSHWEMRILGNELMTATYTNVFRLSNLTLAFLEDTGWYLPNYSLAEHLAWGANRGCIFSTESCYSYMLDQLAKGADSAPFCLAPQDKHLADLFVCTPGRRSFGYCNLVQVAPKSNATNIHPMYTYFGNTSYLKYQGKVIPHDYFGKVDLADFCPFVQQDQILFLSKIALTNLNNYNLEVYGPNSICLSIAPNWILLGRKSTAYEAPVRGAGCYKYRCSHKEGGLIVELAGGLQVLCPAGVPTALINISVCLREPSLTVLGYFHCPECTFFCNWFYLLGVTKVPSPPNYVMRGRNDNFFR
ncbi:Leishmanolysin-like peptidase [Taenia solium]|eukprot:TsM_000199100 transcript=TsM_000199100 gene=TsM_000199100